ncbi:MAG TPA: DUF2971 domain-containing protein, partial [Methylophilaceae bacterium]|nr:DUF2971 domain-containing protein [Methylophilaceae bacterium]
NFRAWSPAFSVDTYVTSVSVHRAEEDKYGRLSMWRAYGGNAGVALVLNGGVMFRESKALAAYSSPVAYMEEDEIGKEILSVAQQIAKNVEYVRGLGEDGLKKTVFHMLRFAAICTKHPSFKEEEEWRVVASPVVESSDLLKSEIELINGIPQKVLKIKLEDHPDKGLEGLTPSVFLDRILIGPCEHPKVIWQSLVRLMDEAGIEEPHKKLFITGIPLRQN